MARKNRAKVEANDDDESFSDPEDFVDDITDEELLADVLKQKPKDAHDVESVIIVDGVPEVEQARLDKLKKVIRKIFEGSGTIVNTYYPADDNGKTKGYIFLEYKDKGSAEDAVRKRNNQKLDKQHTFTCNLFTDFEKYKDVPEKYTSPKPQAYKEFGSSLSNYLMDENCFDQYSVIFDCGTNNGSTTAIYLNSIPEPQEIQKREKWTETYVRWSPLGTFLATFHGKGIALWAGDEFLQIQRFSHLGVQFIEFSPNETYMVSFSPHGDNRSDNPQAIIMWNVRTGHKKRAFHADKPPMQWPVFKWSYDDKYFARMSEDLLSVYETPSFTLLDMKSIKVEGIREFGWSPISNVLAYWVSESKNIPAKVVILTIPAKVERRSMNLFNVVDCQMYWQKGGEYLCVRVARYARMRREEKGERFKGVFYNFDIFHLYSKSVPVDSLEVKEPLQSFSWSPNGNQFAVITGEPPAISVTFYEVRKGQKPVEMRRFEKRSWNTVCWSPQGRFVVLAGLRNMTGALDFIDTSDFKLMASTEHFMMTELDWDATGRYVATGVSWWAHKVDNAYWIWNFQGRILRRHTVDRFCQVLWRPRPPPIINDEEKIKSVMSDNSAQFELQDKMRLSVASRELIIKRQRQMSEFIEMRKKMQDIFFQQKLERKALREGQDTDTLVSSVKDFEEETVEFLIKKETQLCY